MRLIKAIILALLVLLLLSSSAWSHGTRGGRKDPKTDKKPYTQGELKKGKLDGRYYTESEINAWRLLWGYPVNASQVDQGVGGGAGNSVKDLVDTIGATKKATLLFSHNVSRGDTTTYTFSTNETIPSNITCVIQPGAILSIDNGVTLTINGPPEIGLHQAFSGAGTVSFGDGSVKEVYPEWRGAVADGTTDCTSAIQATLDTLPPTLAFNAGGTYKTGVLEIKANIHLRGNGATLLGSGNGMFNVLTALDKVYIEGFKQTWETASGTIGKQFFWNTDDAAGRTAFPVGTSYAITDLRIWNNELGASKISASGATTEARIRDNRWVHSSGVAIAPAYLYLSRGSVDSDSGPVWVEDNFFDVYPPTGSNVDIVKITGGVSNAIISGNFIQNNTTGSRAQVDVFTGAHKMRFVNNTLINTQLHRKQVKGSLPNAPTIYHYDLIMGNSFELQDGFDSITVALYWIGALGTITNNQFILKNASESSIAIDFDDSDVDIGFDTDESVAKIISNNIFDLSAAETTSVAIKHQPGGTGASEGRYTIVSGNILLGGGDFIESSSEYTIVIGNVWGDSGNATGTSINAGQKSMAIGNVADTLIPTFVGGTIGNMVTQVIPDINGADTTPSVLGKSTLKISNSSSITDFDDAYVGQCIILMGSGAGATIVNGTPIKLNGSANFTLSARNTLTLIKMDSSTWVETGRSAL